ncbi:hypothetical protein OHT61_17850 [Streptomyces sp. NBC_00178]|uniref:hypothetical protein n=1 Tax=Streptomyces sp. NBC_00178 TaxID=2975672 RepID=UPI002E2A3BB5|nr:hypothetical protein [Streptomyces sp. NBC_00178]
MAGQQLIFRDLARYPVIAQALDNQWLPSDLAAARQHANAPSGRLPDHVAASSAELRRALVNSGTLVVNRAYFINNQAVSANYLPTAEPSERQAFIDLLNGRALVPFLYSERDPAAEYGWTSDPQVHRAWQRLLSDDAEPALVRFDWDDDANREATDDINHFFSSRLTTLMRLREAPLKKHLGISLDQARAMKEGILTDLAVWATRQDLYATITREAVYKEFLTRPGTEVHEGLLREGEHVVAAKQLIDLLYNLGVPKASGVTALTPPGSPPRSALQELRDDVRSRPDDPEQIGLLLRDVFADALHRAVDGPRSYGSLSLSDITRLRTTEEWYGYVNALDTFVRGSFKDGRVPTPEEFRAGTGDVARLHRGMLGAARRSSRTRQGFQREMKVALVLESAGIALQVTAGEEVSLLAGSLQMATALAGALSVRLEFFDREGRGARSGLGHSLTLPSLQLRNVRKDWEEILKSYGGRVVETGADPRRSQADQQSPHV